MMFESVNPFIQNVSMNDIKIGRHFDCGENSMLIQIVDPATEFPKPYHNFKEIHQFNFLDEEDEIGQFADFVISDSQARSIADLLIHALTNKMHVVVHCHAGLCRSGAVAEVGTIIGFRDTDRLRMPNLLVKKKLLNCLYGKINE